uniref:Uncharacterized protein n=1 Tax=Euplotes harpa TaxID=151035 RepID=A0A7S3J8P5_9SPIT|mmetsp:Transcript_26134/g.30192  ORF Transcript_26134/g.30192 Transcript_26134/m.30192 type:complete len:167 (+) Transcript_26134:777-1277(+)
MSVKESFKNPDLDYSVKSKSENRLFKMTKRMSKICVKPNPKQQKLKFLKGKGNLTNLFQPHSPTKETTYQNFFDGRTLKSKTDNVGELFKVSHATGSLIPDPVSITMNDSKLLYFKNELKAYEEQPLARSRFSTQREGLAHKRFGSEKQSVKNMTNQTLQNYIRFN